MVKLVRSSIVLLVVFVFSASCSMPSQADVGKLEKIRVLGSSLQGNLEGDDPERDVFVYLPPSYEKQKNKRYPVIYFLHGYAQTAEFYLAALNMPDSANQFMAVGQVEAILVFPDAFTRYGGSMYSNSPVTGDWETFIAKDLVAHIDKNYRTIAKRESRGLSGHSMGGYGTIRIGMKFPEVYSSLYAMSACCLLNVAPSKEAVQAQVARMNEGMKLETGNIGNVLLAQAATFAPNPKNPPFYFDWPYKNDELQPIVQGKWAANSPLIFVDQYIPALKQYKAIMIDVGGKDTLAPTNVQFDAALTRYGIDHGWELYDGDHVNKVGPRFAENLLPFFAQHLATQ